MEKQEQLSFSGIIKTAWQFRYTLTLVTVIAAVVTYGITFLITPKFKTTAIIYPTAPINSSKDALGQADNYKGVTELGGEEEAEQLMEVVSGNNLRRKVANKINLWAHYKIDTTNSRKNYYFDNIWNKDINLSLTNFNALRIEVYDADPTTAACIANTIAEQADSVYRAIRKNRAVCVYNAVKETKRLTLDEYNKLIDSLSYYRKLGIIDIPYQVKELYRVKAQEVAAGNKERVNRIEKELETLKRFSTTTRSLESRLDYKQKEIADIEANEKVALLEATQEIPSIFNIDKAEVPEVKAYPRRALFAIGAGLATFILGLFIILLNSYLANEVFNTGKRSTK